MDHCKADLGTTSWRRPGHKADGPNERRVSTRVRHGSTAADAPGICWAARFLYSDGGHRRSHRRSTGPGSEAAAPGWGRPGAERSFELGLVALSSKAHPGHPRDYEK